MHKRRIIQLLLVLFGVFGLAACSGTDQDDGQSGICSTAEDCGDGEACRSGVCQPTCDTDDDCEEGACRFAGVCISECESSDDCGEGQTCREVEGGNVCWPEGVDLNDCELDQDCDNAEYCAEGACVDQSCSSDSDCAGQNICDDGRCRSGCRPKEGDASKPTHCGEGKKCNSQNVCEPIGCTIDSCPEFQKCNADKDPSTCEYTGKCDEDAVCQEYAEQTGSDIPLICQEATNSCIEKPPCEEEGDCDPDEICKKHEDKRNVCQEGCRCTDGCDRDCLTGEICSEKQGNVCVKGCQSDEQCQESGEGDYCVELECVPGCENVDDCPIEGQTCRAGPDGGPTICRPCTEGTCGPTQFCNEELGATEEEKMDSDLGLCDDLPPSCPDDKYGDNQEQKNAYAIQSLPFSAQPNYCRKFDSGDWFTVSADTAKVIEINLDYPQTINEDSTGNLDVALLNSNGDTLVTSAEPNEVDEGDETIRWGVEAKDDFIIHVRGTILEHQNPDTGRAKEYVEYDLDVDVRDAKMCSGDSLEPNNSRQDAKKIEPDKDYKNLEVCGGDKDVYKLEAKQNQNVKFVAEAPFNLGDLELKLYDSEGSVLETVSTQKDVETLEYITQDAQDLFVEVLVANGAGQIDYKMRWTQSDNQCADTYEPNDSCPPPSQSASRLDRSKLTSGGKTINNLTVCNDDDYYAVDLLPLDEFTATATFNRGDGQLQLALYGPDTCQTIVQSASEETGPNNTKTLKINHTPQTGGTYYLLAGKFGGPNNIPYEMDVDVKSGPTCKDDTYDQNGNNDSRSDATQLDRQDVIDGKDDSALVGMQICDQNQDYYCTDLKANDKVEWEVRFKNADGNLDAFLLGPNGNTKDDGVTSTDNETVSHKAQSAGTYCLKVAGKTPVRNSYNVLTFINDQGTADPDCPDIYEDNDKCNNMTCNATELSVASGQSKGFDGLLACGDPYDEDWYKTQVAPGETLNVKTKFRHSNGNLDLTLYDGSTNFSNDLDRSWTSKDVEEVEASSNKQQTLYWRVNAQRGGPSNAYDMTVERKTPSKCTEDGSEEPNDSQNAATDAPVPGQLVGLKKCDGNEDWYEVTLNKDQKFRAFLNHDSSVADLDLELYEAGGQSPVKTATSSDDDEALDYTHTGGNSQQTYYVKVVSKVPARARYDLLFYRDTDANDQIDLGTDGPADQECPDRFENNDKADDASELSIQKYDDLVMCAETFTSDQDFYQVFVPTDATITKEISNFDSQSGALDLTLYQGSANASNTVDQAQTSQGKATVSHKNQGGGTNYILKVEGTNGPFRSFYDLDVGLSFSGKCTDDGLSNAVDPSKSFADKSSSAHTIQAPKDFDMGDSLQLCENTEDWFEISHSGGAATFALDHRKSLGEIEMTLLDSGGNEVETGTPDFGGNVTMISNGSLSSGTYYLRVSPAGQSIVRNAYDLWAAFDDKEPDQPRYYDPYERNDDPNLSSAAPLDLSSKAQFADSVLTGEEEDWFKMTLQANETYNFGTYFGHKQDRDLALELQDSQGNVVQDTDGNNIEFGNDTATNHETAEFSPNSGGTYLLGIKQKAPTTRLTKTLFDINSSGNCLDDQYDTGGNSNNSPGDAATLPSANNTYSLAACGTSDKTDYYEVTAESDGRFNVNIYYNDDVVELSGSIKHKRSGLAPSFTTKANRLHWYSNNKLQFGGNQVDVKKGDVFEIQVDAKSNKTGAYFLRIFNR